ncbi:B2 bradykinin receptor-like [Thalassophryne amazonica]|uniref:B2 bradykinin receptor-like n=1 Tax=Thalassophryne amazonica TaxID=390379 RepID=UPI001470E39D|nr:B2 bradykinin receptor-like [Thalassophryne amazonica]
MFLLLESISNVTSPAIDVIQNSTNRTACHSTDWWLYTMQPVYIFLIAALGIVCNLFVLSVFCFHKKPCNVPEIYLTNLAAADLVLVSCLPFWAVYITKKFNWIFGKFLCQLVNMGIRMNAYCSIYFLVLISIDRYVALVYPLSHGRKRSPKLAKLGCLMMWGVGFLLGLPTFIYRKVVPSGQNDTHKCIEDEIVRLVSDLLLAILGFIIPVSIICYCTAKIVHALRNRLSERYTTENTENKATTLMLVVLVAFLICWVPFHVVKILNIFKGAGLVKRCDFIIALENSLQIFGYLAFFNSVLNPILYVIAGRSFRKKVCELCMPNSFHPVGSTTL